MDYKLTKTTDNAFRAEEDCRVPACYGMGLTPFYKTGYVKRILKLIDKKRKR